MKGFGRLVWRGFSQQTRIIETQPNRNNNNIRFFISRRGFIHASSSSPTSFHHQFDRTPFASFKSSPVSPSPFQKWGFLAGQRRSMFIETQSTPNPSSLMFYPGKPVMEVGSADFPNARSAMSSPLAKALYGIDGITRVFFGSDFVTVTKSEEASWDFLKPEIFAAIMDFYSSGQPLFLDSETAAAKDTAIHEDDSEIVAMIKELLETRIRPAVQDDGGDIEYRGFDPETGVVKLRMQGACSGCPSSSVTLKSGIENMLMHYVPEVKSVEEELDAEDEDAALTGQME
ncbi:NifU-like protein 4 [Morus notabilis]|uniref:NifU-like protein 4 n=1 Tax=Morus notabilis TaxID=981085 RepID=W9QGE4_9ROSA|nr:nifU-like protein 4, mitochondrial [Morus notabilis]EXB36952.1 NifU-like protein 4 [Morus notabilis]